MKLIISRFLGGITVMAFATFLFSFKPVLVRMALENGLTPKQLMVLRLGVASPLFLITVAVLGRTREMKIKMREFLFIALVVSIGMGGAMLFSFYAIMYLGASVSTLLIFVFPAFTTILSYLIFRQAVTRLKIVSLITSFTGIGFVILPLVENGASPVAGTAPAVGIFYALITALCWASTQISLEKITREKAPLIVSVYTTGIMFILFFALNGMPPLKLDAETWGIVILLGSVTWYLPFLLTVYGIKRLGASNSSIVQTLGPGMTVLIAWTLLGETLTAVQVAGMTLLITAVYILRNEAYFTGKALTAPDSCR